MTEGWNYSSLLCLKWLLLFPTCIFGPYFIVLPPKPAKMAVPSVSSGSAHLSDAEWYWGEISR